MVQRKSLLATNLTIWIRFVISLSEFIFCDSRPNGCINYAGNNHSRRNSTAPISVLGTKQHWPAKPNWRTQWWSSLDLLQFHTWDQPPTGSSLFLLAWSVRTSMSILLGCSWKMQLQEESSQTSLPWTCDFGVMQCGFPCEFGDDLVMRPIAWWACSRCWLDEHNELRLLGVKYGGHIYLLSRILHLLK